MFIKINHSRLRNAEFLQLMRNIHLILVEEGHLPLESLTNKLETEVDNLGVLFKSNRKNPFTEDIHKYDDKRDITLNGIIRIVKGFRNHWDKTISEGAMDLSERITNHGSNIAGLNLQEETAVIISLINEIENTPTLSNTVDLIGLSPWIDKLRHYNDRCSELIINRLDYKADFSQINPKGLRDVIKSIYEELTRTIDAHIILGSEGDYTILKNRINAMNKEFIATLNLRK